MLPPFIFSSTPAESDPGARIQLHIKAPFSRGKRSLDMQLDKKQGGSLPAAYAAAGATLNPRLFASAYYAVVTQSERRDFLPDR